MKFLLSFLFTSSLFFTLSAQDINNRTLFTGGILLDKYTQAESYSLNGSGRDLGEVVGVPSNFLADGQKMRGQLSLGLKKIDAKGDYVAANIFIGYEKWERRNLVEIEDENLGKLFIPIIVGRVEQNSFGLNLTKSFCITKQESRLLAYLGARAEGMYTIGKYGSGLEDISRTNRQKIDFQIAFVPEIVYLFPGDRFTMSLASHLLPIGLEWHNNEILDPSLPDEQRVNSYQNFDFLNHEKSRLEIGFGWLL